MKLDDAEHAIKLLLDALGVDEGEHTADTPARVARSFKDQLWGYSENPDDYLQTTFPGPERPGLVVQAGIDIQSTCAHHLLPILGHATVAYHPRAARVVGLSKLTRVAYAYSARLQVQECLGQQIVDCITRVLAPRGSACLITAAHDCMRLRGVRSPASMTTTVATRGELTSNENDIIRQLHIGHTA
jgi:GTP cyclohydrolase IA